MVVKHLTLKSRVLCLGLWIQVLGHGLEPQVLVNITASNILHGGDHVFQVTITVLHCYPVVYVWSP